MAPPSRFNRKFVFVAGLHRSGTSLLADLLAEHPAISGFQNTGVYMDEGQHLQSVYPVGRKLGADAVGRLGFDPFAHFTERSPFAAPAKADELFRQWVEHWDPEKPIFLEKSPPNIIRTRYLQSCFPVSVFILITRHPVANAVATKKWCRRNPIVGIIANWCRCHRIFLGDQRRLKRSIVLRYEDLVIGPERELRRLTDFIGLSAMATTARTLDPDVNRKYFSTWRDLSSRGRLGRLAALAAERAFEPTLQLFGYSFREAKG